MPARQEVIPKLSRSMKLLLQFLKDCEKYTLAEIKLIISENDAQE